LISPLYLLGVLPDNLDICFDTGAARPAGTAGHDDHLFPGISCALLAYRDANFSQLLLYLHTI